MFLLNTLTVPKIKDLVNKPNEQYRDIFATLNNNTNNNAKAPTEQNMTEELSLFLNDLKKGSALSNPKGSALSNPKGSTLSNPYGDGNNTPQGSTLSNPYDENNTPQGYTLSNPKGSALSNPYGEENNTVVGGRNPPF